MADVLNHAEYLLLNKDTGILRFSCTWNDFDEPEFFIQEWLSDLRPIGFGADTPSPEGNGTLSAFLERRKAPKHRRHIQALLERFGCDDTEGFLRVTHALPLNGTFWVEEAGSTLTWADLKNLEGFRFSQHPQITASGERLDTLSAIVNRQIAAVLQ